MVKQTKIQRLSLTGAKRVGTARRSVRGRKHAEELRIRGMEETGIRENCIEYFGTEKG